MPPKREPVALIAVPEPKAAPTHPLILAAQAQRDKWVARLADARTRVEECGVQIRRSHKATADAESNIAMLLQQATDLVYPKEVKEVPQLPVLAPVSGKAAGGAASPKGGKTGPTPIQPVVQEPVAPPPPVLTEAQLKKKAKQQLALINAFKKKKYVPQADELAVNSPSADAAGESTPRSSTDIRPSRPNDVKDELWDPLMKLRDSRIDNEDRIVALKQQIEMLEQRLSALVEMERVTRYASIGAENDIVVTTQRVEEMQRIAKEQAKLEWEAKQSRPQSSAGPSASSAGPVAATQLGPIKNAPVAAAASQGLSPRNPRK